MSNLTSIIVDMYKLCPSIVSTTARSFFRTNGSNLLDMISRVEGVR